MPTYQNNGSVAAKIMGCSGDSVAPGGTIATLKYICLAETSPFVLISHEPYTYPSERLFADTLPCSISSGLAKFRRIDIINDSGASIVLTFNTDSGNTRVMLSGQCLSIPQQQEIEALSISGSGTGSVYVYGSNLVGMMNDYAGVR